MFCRNCGSEMSEGDIFCTTCGTQLTQANHNQPTQKLQTADKNVFRQTKPKTVKPKKQIGKLPVILGAIIVVLIVAIVIIATSGSSDISNIKTKLGMSSETYEVFQTAKKTLFDTGSASVEVDVQDYGSGYTTWVDFAFGDNLKDSKLCLRIKDSGETEDVLGFLDGNLYHYRESEPVPFNSAFSEYEDMAKAYALESIEDGLNMLINGRIDEVAFKDFYNTALRAAITNTLIMTIADYNDDTDQYYNEATGTYDFSSIKLPFEIPDYDTVMGVVEDFLVNGLSKKAVTINKSNNDYRYEVDIDEFLQCLLDFTKENDVVSNIIEGCAEIIDENLNEIYEELEEELEYLKEDDEIISGRFRIEDGRLTYVKSEFFGVGFTVTLDNINNLSVDEDRIKNIKAEYSYYDYYY